MTVPNSAAFAVGTQFNIVQATSGTDGSTVLVTIQSPTDPLYTFTAAPTVNGSITLTTTGVAAAVAPLLPVLDALPATPETTDVTTAIDALPSAAAVADALVQMAPSSPNLNAALVTYQDTKQFQNVWKSRLDNVMCDQVSSTEEEKKNSACQLNDSKNGLWMKGFGSLADQDTIGLALGYESQTVGAMIAYDVPVGNSMSGETRAGMGVGYSRSKIDSKSRYATADINTYQATAYIGHARGPWFVDGNLSLGWNDYDSTRGISYPGIERTAKGEYSGQDYNAFVDTGYHFFARKFTISPLASLQYSHVDLDGYTETGASNINLKVQSQSYNFLESGLGIKIERDFKFKGKILLPEIHTKWSHKMLNPALKNHAAYNVSGSATFTTAGLRTDDDTFNIGGGIELLSCSCTEKTWSLEAVYDHDWRNDDYLENRGMLKLTSRF